MPEGRKNLKKNLSLCLNVCHLQPLQRNTKASTLSLSLCRSGSANVPCASLGLVCLSLRLIPLQTSRAGAFLDHGMWHGRCCMKTMPYEQAPIPIDSAAYAFHVVFRDRVFHHHYLACYMFAGRRQWLRKPKQQPKVRRCMWR